MVTPAGRGCPYWCTLPLDQHATGGERTHRTVDGPYPVPGAHEVGTTVVDLGRQRGPVRVFVNYVVDGQRRTMDLDGADAHDLATIIGGLGDGVPAQLSAALHRAAERLGADEDTR